MIETRELVIEPEIRRNEILRLLESGLQDISISRSRLPWGIPFPGTDGYTIYVWFDAVINYLAATGFPDAVYRELWPADLHVIGKGISRFHCTLWPAMCLSAGIEPPKMVWVHGYVLLHGSKMSKTAGTAITLDEAIDRHGPDALRYFLLREIGFQSDGEFSWERFDARYTADLADGLGNLAARSLAMIEKYRDGVVPEGPVSSLDREVMEKHLPAYEAAMADYDLRGALEAAWTIVSAADLYITQSAPWSLAKAQKNDELNQVLATLYRSLYRIAVLTQPFMPGKIGSLWEALGVPFGIGSDGWARLASPPAGVKVRRPAILFPKPAQAIPPA
jgi:methionyl-tRNA synthetase